VIRVSGPILLVNPYYDVPEIAVSRRANPDGVDARINQLRSGGARFAKLHETLLPELIRLHFGTSTMRAMACKAPRHSWHMRQRWQRVICNLRNLRGPAKCRRAETVRALQA
jgi:hypothetical protein